MNKTTSGFEDAGFDAVEHARKSAESLAVVRRMEDALAAGSNDMRAHFHDDFRWIGNYGCGTKNGVDAFRRAWQLPFRAAFSERDYRTERFMADGEWVSCFGHIEATHSGVFMGIEATGKRIKNPVYRFLADPRRQDCRQLGLGRLRAGAWRNWAGTYLPAKAGRPLISNEKDAPVTICNLRTDHDHPAFQNRQDRFGSQ
jgi:predicted ester cyclase